MIVSAILKAIFFYFIFVFIRKLITGHKTLKAMGERMNTNEGGQYNNRYNHSYTQKESNKYDDKGTIEAEFRHLDD